MSSQPLLHPAGGSVPEGEELLERSESRRTTERLKIPGPLVLETKGTNGQKQLKLPWVERLSIKETIASSLFQFKLHDLAAKLDKCHTKQTYKRCRGCGSHSVFFNRCDLAFCPICQPSLVKRRHKALKWWLRQSRQAKHVTLTIRNSPILSPEYVAWAKAALRKLRRSKFCSNWKGGFWSMEITNEGKGWHLHFHLIVDAKWIDKDRLKVEWAKRIDQAFSVTWVRDARDAEYLREVSKYVCKPDEICKWQAAEIAQFAAVINNCRTFGVFGSMHGSRDEFKEWRDAQLDREDNCECGECDWEFLSPNEFEWRELVNEQPHAPPKKEHNPMQLALAHILTSVWPD